jgi:hypothetical protein
VADLVINSQLNNGALIINTAQGNTAGERELGKLRTTKTEKVKINNSHNIVSSNRQTL